MLASSREDCRRVSGRNVAKCTSVVQEKPRFLIFGYVYLEKGCRISFCTINATRYSTILSLVRFIIVQFHLNLEVYKVV